MKGDPNDLGKKRGKGKGRGYIPESLLNAANIVHVPVLLGDILLTNRNARPSDTHLSNTVDIILVEVDLQRTEVTLGPLSQTPLLDNLLGLVERHELASDIAVEDGELAANLGALELAGRATCEGSNALRVGESVVELAGGGTELIGGSHGGGVDGDLAGLGGSGRLGAGGLGGLGLGVDDGFGEAAGGVHAGCVLKVLAVLGDEGVGEPAEGGTELRDELRAHQVLYGLLGVGVGVVFNLELFYGLVLLEGLPWETGTMNVRRTHLPRCRGLPRGCEWCR